MAALAMTLSLPAVAQQTTGDPFLDAMLRDQERAKDSAEKQDAAAPEAKPAETAAAEEAAAERPLPPTRFVSRASDTALVPDAEVNRQIGAETGIFSNENVYEGKPVRRVTVRYVAGKATVPDSRLYDVIQTRSGSAYNAARVNDDLERLIQRGLVDNNARVAVEPVGDGVAVIFEVRPASVMGGVGFTGNRRFKEKELRSELKLQSSAVINDRELSAARAQIIKMYQEAGYPDVQVTWRHAGTARQGYHDIIFDIAEGREMSMDHIRFVGNHAFDSKQLRQIMETKERGLFTWITKSGRINREKVEDDLQAIVRHYRNYGYLRARITRVEYLAAPKASGPQRLTMRIHLEEGPRYKVRHVSFRNISAYTPQELEPGLSMLGGDIYSLQKVSDDSRMIREYYGAKGYADADVRPDIDEVGTDAHGTRLVDICYDVHEGDRYNVGRINVLGNTKTKPYVILRELPIKPGQPLNSVDLEIAKKRLENLNYFDMVNVSQSASGAPGYRDINVNVHEKMTGNFSVGVAFSSVQSVYLYTNITQSNFDIRGFAGGSFVGGGQRLTLSGRLGTETQAASVYLLEPWFFDRKLALGNELFYSRSTYMSDYYEQTNYGYAISLRRALNDRNSVKLEYRLEHYKLDPEGDAPVFFRENSGDFNRSNLQLSYEYDSRDAQITPREGGNLEAYASWSGPGSTVQTYTVGLNGSAYYNSFWDSIFSVNFGIQTVDALKGDEVVPLFERCYLGGPNNLRGFRYRDVGIIDPALSGDETMGGNSSAFVQLEASLPIIESLRFAVFMDFGFVNADSFDFSTSELSADYGVGLRLNLPMGPIAVDYAIPFRTGNAVDRNGQFQFYVDYKY